MRIEIPDPSLVVLVGAAGSGKTTFARRHFAPAEVLSSDVCRALVANDDSDQKSTRDAFEVLHLIAAKRLSRKLLTVIDSTNVYASARAPLLELARTHEVPAVAVVFFISARISEARRGAESERPVNEWVIRRQKGALNKTLDALHDEGFAAVHVLRTLEDVDAATVERVHV